MREKLILPLAAAFCLFAAAPVAAYNPPAGGELAADLASPLTLGGGALAAGGPLGAALPSELLVNPALSAGEQRYLIDVSYAGLYGAGRESGYGNIANLGTVIPTAFAVFGASINFIQSPFDSILPLGTSFGFNLTVSKDLTECLYGGVGLSARFGSGTPGVAASLGALYNFGDLAALKDFKLGVSLTGLGTAFKPTDAYGIIKKDELSDGYSAPFTLRTGVSFLLLRNSVAKAGLSAGLAFPTFQNVIVNLGAELEVKEVFFAKIGWTANIREAIQYGDAESLYPSVALGVRIKIGSGAISRAIGRQEWEKSELMPAVGYKYLEGGIHAFSAGATLRLGLADVDGPEIKIELPEADLPPGEP